MVDFLNFTDIRYKLSKLDGDKKPLFGEMTPQQMVEHLSLTIQISNGSVEIPSKVSEEESTRRKVFLDSDHEMPMNWDVNYKHGRVRVSYASRIPLRFDSLLGAINDLDYQMEKFLNFYDSQVNPTAGHPYFGELDYEYWVKYHNKHFTHHFKQFDLL